ncbi:HTH domain-containing protein [Terrihabitans soli]|uniref:HTH domain-containing protein n=1 Tax=Terrihabitans soli TaxID=708113 RepID=UPI001CA33472|nr:HTH domain-containing protein [Terrihabitans soli]
MNQYLEIAEKILSDERRPMSARAILRQAYATGIVPHHLHGQTQHKTLQARLSEDILERREKSLFFRTAPGQFFLRRFLDNKDIPIRHRTPMIARRRTRDLLKGKVLTASKRIFARNNEPIQIHDVLKHSAKFSYENQRELEEDSAPIWSFTVVRRDNCVLSYRSGRYRDDRDEFTNKRTIGFINLVQQHHRTLFDGGSSGILESGIEAAVIDLDFPEDNERGLRRAVLKFFLWVSGKYSHDTLLAVVLFDCPDWYEPTKHRLSLNNLQWLDLSSVPNDLDDFDPWSQKILQSHYELRRAGVPLISDGYSGDRRY